MLNVRQLGKSAWVGSALLALPLVGIALLAATVLPAAAARLATLFLIYVTAVLGNQIYSGNSGIMSFGHTSFMAIGAYASALLTISPAAQATALPHLPGWIAAMNGQPLPVALAGALVIVLIVALIFGLPIARLGGSAASIATLGLLVITHVTLVASTDITRGSQTFFGIPRGAPIWLVLGCAVTAVVIARLYRSSRDGLALRAAREDEIAAGAVGVDVVRLRFRAFVLGALLCGASGALYAHFLGAFSPKDFYFNLTFLLLSMLILGGITTVSGAVGGTAVIVLLVEFLRRVEAGGSLAGLTLPPVFGLTDIGIGLVILAVMYRLREGLFGELVHLQGGYQHDLRGVKFNDGNPDHPYDSGVEFGEIVVVILLLFQFIWGFAGVSGVSMYPTLHDKDVVLYDRVSGHYAAGDVVIVQRPDGETFVKRIVAVPGDTINIEGGVLYVNGKSLTYDCTLGATYSEGSEITYPLTLGDKEYFVLGDNRENSEDSRSFGAVTPDAIKGRLLLRFGVVK